jgi:hypothetical protein
LNWDDISNLLVILGIALLFVSVFLAFREFGYLAVEDMHLIPAVLAALALGIVFLGTSAVIRGIKKE